MIEEIKLILDLISKNRELNHAMYKKLIGKKDFLSSMDQIETAVAAATAYARLVEDDLIKSKILEAFLYPEDEK